MRKRRLLAVVVQAVAARVAEPDPVAGSVLAEESDPEEEPDPVAGSAPDLVVLPVVQVPAEAYVALVEELGLVVAVSASALPAPVATLHFFPATPQRKLSPLRAMKFHSSSRTTR